jgi:hypothetical protein
MEDGKVLLPIVSLKRECGDCTKCCEGWMSGAAYEHKFGKIDGVRTPCFFLEQGLGCTIYEDRPQNPCAAYKCQWLVNPDVPEDFKPNNKHYIVSKKGRSYFVITRASSENTDDEEFINWWIEYVTKNNFNLSYPKNDTVEFVGSERLRQTLGYSQKDLQPDETPRQERLANKEIKNV